MAQTHETIIKAMGKADRDTTFDIMKGIGILLVLLGHVWRASIPITNHVILSFHMPLFFIIAGYFSKPFTNWTDFKGNLAKYFRRLVVPMLLTETMITLWSILIALTKGNSWDTVIVNALSIFWADVYGPNTPWGHVSLGVIWFLGALLVSKTLLMLLSRLNGWAIPVSLIISYAAIMLNKVFPYSIWCITLGMSALPFVVIGWWARNHPIPLWFKISCIACWVLALFFSELEMYAFRWECYPLDILGACGATYCVYLLSQWIDRHTKVIGRVLVWLGITSLAIMCVHGFELESHLGNHLRALLGLDLSVAGLYVWRYAITIAIAGLLIYIPKIKKIFV